jgi:hypothetical protein
MVSDKVDANPRNGTRFFEASHGKVLLIVRKATNFGTMGSQCWIEVCSEETSKLTLGVFLLETKCS